MNLQIFTIKKFLRWILIIFVISSNWLGFCLKKDDNYYLQVFLKECKYIEEKVIRHLNGNLRDFSFSYESDEE